MSERAASEATLRCPHCGDAHPRDAKACPMTGRPMPGAFVPGQVLEGKYRIVVHIADGGMGAVYEAEHLALGKRVAIKTLHPDLSKSEDLVQRLQKEARAASAIGHEHIVDVQDLGRTPDGSVFIVMELLKGQNLADRLKEEGGLLSVQRASKILKQVVAALAAAHKVGIIHRDLKPENIYLITRRGDPDFVKVLDFGIAKVVGDGPDAKLESTGFVLGTPYYMAPEQARGGAVDHRVDIYACGALLYHMVTGRVPFSAPNFNALMFEIASGRYPPPRAIVPDIPAAFEQIVQWAMALDPAQRFQSAEQFVQALAPYEKAGAAAGPKMTIPHSAVPTLVLDAHNEGRLRDQARPVPAPAGKHMGAIPQDTADEDAETTVHPENPYLTGEAETPPVPTLPAALKSAPSEPGPDVTQPTVLGKRPNEGAAPRAPAPEPVGKPVPAAQAKTVPMMEAPILPMGPVSVPIASVPVQPIPHQPGPMPPMQPIHPAQMPQMGPAGSLQPGMTPGNQYARPPTPVLPGPPPGAQMISQPVRPYPITPGQSPAAMRAAMALPAQAAPATRAGRTGSRRYESSSSKSVIITVIVGVVVGLGLGGGIIWFVRYQRAGTAPRQVGSVTVKNQPGGLPQGGGLDDGEAPEAATPPAGGPTVPAGKPGTRDPAGTPDPGPPGAARIDALLTFEVSPAEAAQLAEIRVDDVPVAGSTYKVTVKPGQKVRVAVKADGFSGYDRRISIQGDITIDVRLSKKRPASSGGGRPSRPDKPTGPGGSVGDL